MIYIMFTILYYTTLQLVLDWGGTETNLQINIFCNCKPIELFLDYRTRSQLTLKGFRTSKSCI